MDASTLDYFGDEAAPQHAFRTSTDVLANGEYEFEVADAALDRTEGGKDICRVGLRTTNGVVFEHTYWLDKQRGVNGFLAELAALGYPAHTWGNGAGKTPLSQAIPQALRTLAGKKFRAIKSSRQGNTGTVFHEIRITGPVSGRPMPSLTPAAAATTPPPAQAPSMVPAYSGSANDVPF